MKRLFKKKAKYQDIDPEEIFLDEHNSPEFNQHRFEGRMELSLSKRSISFLFVAFLLVEIVFLGRLWNLEVVRGAELAKRAEQNHLEHSLIFAERGMIYDRTGKKLAWNVPIPDEGFSEREYATSTGLSQIVGYVSYPEKDSSGVFFRDEISGKDGIEKRHDKELAGTNGLKILEVNALQDKVSESTIDEPEHGQDITLSIDASLQNEIYQEIATLANKVHFQGGAAAIMDVRTGELLSLVTFPEYDSNVLTNGSNEEITAELNDPRHLFLNRATRGLYAPGSIVKPFMAIAALSEGVITPNKKLYSAGYISIPNPYDPQHPTIMHDWEKHGWVDVRDAIALSCDDYFYMVGGGYRDQPGLGIDRIDRYMEAFGIGQPTGSQLPETAGVVPSPEWKKTAYKDGNWYLGDTYNTSIGQGGFQVTPLQMVRAEAALANRGTLITPTLIKGDTGTRQPVAIDVPDSIYEVVQEGMRQGVTTGITTALNLPGVDVAAKTGTAEVGLEKHYVNSWVTGFFPYEDPHYAFALVMEKGPEENLIGATYIMQQVLLWMTKNTPQYLRADSTTTTQN